MRPTWVALLLSLLGLGATYYTVGSPVVRAYPSADGTMVVKLTLSRAPNFVAYLRTGGTRQLDAGGADS